jgi:heptosyltransferase-2
MSIPALHALRSRYPRAYIAIVARPSVAGLYAREPFCDELILLEGQRGWKSASGLWQAARRLKRMQFDCAILLQNAFEAAALTRMAGIPVRIGYDRDARGWLLTQAVAVPHQGAIPKHQRFYYLELLKRAGLIPEYPLQGSIRLAGAAEAAKQGRARFSRLGLTKTVIGVSPGAAYGGAKRWLPERFAAAAALVAQENGATVAVFGTPLERSICAAVSDGINALGHTATNFAGSTSLPEFIELTAACALYITNDSGPMHIASALGVPTVVIFGPTDEFATGPSGVLNQIVREPVDCSPCLLRECPIDHRCMTRVTAERVASAALHLIENRTA